MKKMKNKKEEGSVLNENKQISLKEMEDDPDNKTRDNEKVIKDIKEEKKKVEQNEEDGE